jgi:hypothetical protein
MIDGIAAGALCEGAAAASSPRLDDTKRGRTFGKPHARGQARSPCADDEYIDLIHIVGSLTRRADYRFEIYLEQVD